MRRPFIAGNWKMNLNRAESVALAAAVAKGEALASAVDVAVCPPSVYLDAVAQAVRGSSVGVGAQNMYFEAKGAFTGELSAAMLLDVGCRYVILGHSERRHILGEFDELVNKKTHAALAAGLVPIVCVGETLEEREAGRTADLIHAQVEGSLAGITAEQMRGIVIAYEPVWAIGTGKTATPAQAEAVHLDLRKLLAARYNADVADEVVIQYGGSVNAKNAAELLSQPNVDGALVGGASLKAEDFLSIVQAGVSRT
ncbi:MAG: triose-phosphate isomerase [Pirellulales bacterium]